MSFEIVKKNMYNNGTKMINQRGFLTEDAAQEKAFELDEIEEEEGEGRGGVATNWHEVREV